MRRKTVIIISAILFGILLAACSKSNSEPFMGNTNWLLCDGDSDCDEGACECGLCTRSCETSGDCAALDDAVCRSVSDGVCGAGVSAQLAVCLPACSASTACPGGLSCEGGSCVPAVPSEGLDASSPRDATTELAQCDELPSAPARVRIFEAGRGLIEDTSELGTDALGFAGMVTELGSGSPDDINGVAFGFGDDASWMRLSGEGMTWTLLERRTGITWPVESGDAVRGEYFAVPSGFAPPLLSLRLFRDDEELVYYELGSAVSELQPPADFALERGEALCEGRQTCGSFEDNALQVELPDGDSLALQPGEEASSGGFTINYLAGRHDDEDLSCADTWYSRVELAIVAE